MNFLVVYFSRGGKTGKVATAIANELGCEAVDLAKAAPVAVGEELLVVGSGTYGGMPGPKLSEFLESLPQRGGGKAAVFSTSAGPSPLSIPKMKKALQEKGYEIVSTFDCRGHFMLINRGRPNDQDLEGARAFARELKSGPGGI
jgi:flavodoxin